VHVKNANTIRRTIQKVSVTAVTTVEKLAISRNVLFTAFNISLMI